MLARNKPAPGGLGGRPTLSSRVNQPESGLLAVRFRALGPSAPSSPAQSSACAWSSARSVWPAPRPSSGWPTWSTTCSGSSGSKAEVRPRSATTSSSDPSLARRFAAAAATPATQLAPSYQSTFTAPTSIKPTCSSKYPIDQRRQASDANAFLTTGAVQAVMQPQLPPVDSPKF